MNSARIPIKIGILGAARIATRAIVYPAQATEHVLYGVASRSRDRGEAFAKEHGVLNVFGSYQELIEDPEITAISSARSTDLSFAREQALTTSSPFLCELLRALKL